jgi:hypothetical protein
MKITKRNWINASNIAKDYNKLPNYMLLAIGGSHIEVDIVAAVTLLMTLAPIGQILLFTHCLNQSRDKCSTTSQVISADKKLAKPYSKAKKLTVFSAISLQTRMTTWSHSNIFQECMMLSLRLTTTVTSLLLAVVNTNRQMFLL